MQAVIFDLDGTLCDSREAMFWQYQMLTQEFDGQAASREAIAAAAHGTTESIVRTLVRNPDVPLETLVRRQAELRAQSESLFRLYSGVDELLPILRRVGLRVGAFTAGGPPNVAYLQQAGIHHYFDDIITADDVIRPKPDPEGIMLLLERFGVPAVEAVIVGDTPADIEVGQRAGLGKTVAVTHGFGTLEALAASAPTHIIHDIPSLLDVLE